MLRTLSVAAFGATFGLPAFACAGFEAHDAYARSSTMMSTSGAAFMVLHNHGTTDCHIASARSDIAERTELHTHIADSNGVMRMVHIEEGFPLPAGGEVLLERGGNHVMFLGLTRPMEQGSSVAVTLVFADGSEATIDVPVDNDRQPTQGAMHGHNHGEGHGHGDHAAAGHGATSQPAGHGHGGMSMPVDQAGMADEDAIRAVMMAQFDRPEAPLTVAPVVVQGDVAMAGWAQDGNGGRALLRKGEGGWFIALCAGAQLMDETVLSQHGLTDGAATLIAAMRHAEHGVSGGSALFDGFTDFLVFEAGHGHHGHGHGHAHGD